MKLSSNTVAVPELLATKKPATAKSSTASHRISSPLALRVKTPSMRSAMAPLAKVISGSIAAMSLRWDTGPRSYGTRASRACSAAARLALKPLIRASTEAADTSRTGAG